jgi:hypothetical protein
MSGRCKYKKGNCCGGIIGTGKNWLFIPENSQPDIAEFKI